MKLHSLIAAALLSVAGASQAALIHQYELNGDLKDAKVGPDLGAIAGGVLGPTGYAFSGNKGLNVFYALGSVYTIDMAFRLSDDRATYQRLLNFQFASADHGLYTTGNQFCFYRGGCLLGGSFAPQEDMRLTLTRDSASVVTLYKNGNALFSFQDSTGETNLTGARRLSFFKDDGGEAATGSVDFIHLYDNALSQQEVRALAPVSVPEPASRGRGGAGLARAGRTRRRQARGAA